MDKNIKKIISITGGVIATGAIIAGMIFYYKRKKNHKGLLPPGSKLVQPANFLTTNNNTIPSNFINWYGGNTYLENAPRGIRNNNPGNLVYTQIKWKGKIPKEQNKDRHFEMFIAPVYGLRAMIKDLKNDIEKGQNTVPKLVEEYSPRYENNTDHYIDTVCKDLKVSKRAKLLPTKNTLRLLVLSMTRVETGGNYVSPRLFEKAYAMI